MAETFLEIAEGNRHLHHERGFVLISEGPVELARIPYDQIAAIIAHSHGLSYSHNVLVELASRGIPLILSDKSHIPACVVWPISGNHRLAARIRAQGEASAPLGKRLWKTIVQSKLKSHLAALAAFGGTSPRIEALIPSVKSGDPENIEAQAARIYWPMMFGEAFRREQESEVGINSFLNYGYSILRACIARSLMGAGLHPSLGIHHKTDVNTFALADDLMEPFRPLVDTLVRHMWERGRLELNRETKKSIVKIASFPLQTMRGVSTVQTAADNLASSLALVYERQREELELPDFKKADFSQSLNLMEKGGWIAPTGSCG